MIVSVAKRIGCTKEELLNTGVLFILSLVLSLLVFSVFIFYGIPSVEDYLVVYKMVHSLDFNELFTTTMSDKFNLYDTSVTSRTDIYRPIYEFTFIIDEWLSDLLGIEFYKVSNILYFFISIFIFSLFVNQHIGLKYAVLAVLLYSIHSGHVHSQYSYVNRLGVLVSIYIFSIIYVFYQLLKRKGAFKVLLVYLLALLFILTKETGVIIVILPGFAFVLFVFINKLDLKSQLRNHGRSLALHTSILLGLVLVYLYVRTLLFDGIGNYHPGVSFSGIIINMLLACQQISGFKIMYAVFALPVIVYLGYAFLKSRSKFLLVLIFLLIIGIYGPSLIYSVGKRYSCASAMFFLFFFLYFLKDIKKNYLKWLLVASFAVPLAVQAVDIKLKQLSAFKVRAGIEQQLENLKLDADTIAVILPLYLSDEALLFKNGIPTYLGRLQNFQNKQIIVLGLIHDSNKFYSLGTTKRSYSPGVTKHNSRVTVNYPEDARFDIPHLPKKYVEFDNKFFYYQNHLEAHEAVFDVKVNNFQLIYFEKLDYDKFAFKVI